jgi:predicted transcriptional regulator
MPEPSELCRRERQIMDAVFALGRATVKRVVETIPSPPTAMAVRRMMHILEEKGYLRRRPNGREVIYVPRQTKGKAGRRAFERVLETFFGGSLEEALAAHLHSRNDRVSADERERLIALIEWTALTEQAALTEQHMKKHPPISPVSPPGGPLR